MTKQVANSRPVHRYKLALRDLKKTRCGEEKLEKVGRVKGETLLLYGRMFDFYRNGTYGTLSDGKTRVLTLPNDIVTSTRQNLAQPRDETNKTRLLTTLSYAERLGHLLRQTIYCVRMYSLLLSVIRVTRLLSVLEAVIRVPETTRNRRHPQQGRVLR